MEKEKLMSQNIEAKNNIIEPESGPPAEALEAEENVSPDVPSQPEDEPELSIYGASPKSEGSHDVPLRLEDAECIQSEENTTLVLVVSGKKVKVAIPTSFIPDPPAWKLIEQLTGISATNAQRAWTDDGTNPAAEKAASKLSELASVYEVSVRLVEGVVELVDASKVHENMLEDTKPKRAKYPGSCWCGKRVKAGQVVLRHVVAGILGCAQCQEDDIGEPVFDHCEVDDDELYFETYDRDLVKTARELLRSRAKGLFVYGRVGGESSGGPAMVKMVNGRATLVQLGEAKIRGVLIHHIQFRSTKNGVRTKPPSELVQHLVQHPDPELPGLMGIARMPMMALDGSIIQTKGYNPNTGWYYAPDVNIEPVPDNPTPEDVETAKHLIVNELFGDFPFVGGAVAGAVSALIEQVVQPLIRGPRPLYAYDAPVGGQGTGKTKCAKVTQAVVSGAIKVDSYARREEEMEKRITSYLLAGRTSVILDNVTTVVGSDALAALATSEVWSGRILGASEATAIPNTATWMLTMNGATFNTDMARRFVIVRLDARMSDPSRRRGFKHADIEGWALAHRAELIRACLVLARTWYVAGQPADPNLVMGSFETWAKVVGGILHHVGVDGLSECLDESKARNEDVTEATSLVGAWLGMTEKVTATDLADLAKKEGLYERVLADVNESWRGRAMANALAPLVGRTFEVSGRRVVIKREPGRANTTRYWLEDADEPAAA